MVDFHKLLQKHQEFKRLCAEDDLVKQGEMVDNLSEEDAKTFLRLAVRRIGSLDL